MTIRGIHDLAGARIVVPGQTISQGLVVGDHVLAKDVQLSSGWYLQNIAVKSLKDRFAGIATKEIKVIDRRQEPSAGYRAVHLVIFVDGLPVEVQVRTELQHSWAEVAERLGDAWGRGLRYGDGPDDPERIVAAGDPPYTRRAVAELLIQISDRVAVHEEARNTLEVTELRLGLVQDQDASEVAAAWQNLEGLHASVTRRDEELRGVLSDFLSIVETVGR
jgi:hypothetical protein